MDKYKRYYGVAIFLTAVIVTVFIAITAIKSMTTPYMEYNKKVAELTQTLETKQNLQKNIKTKLAKLKSSIMTSQKKIYSPVEDKLGSDTLFFTLYSDLIEMVHSNSIKIKSIDYEYNPEGDSFVAQKDVYFVCNVNMELVSNYVNLGKLIQDIYQYPYYIRINNLEVYPYPKDKKILLSTLSVRLYAHTSPDGSGIEKESD